MFESFIHGWGSWYSDGCVSCPVRWKWPLLEWEPEKTFSKFTLASSTHAVSVCILKMAASAVGNISIQRTMIVLLGRSIPITSWQVKAFHPNPRFYCYAYMHPCGVCTLCGTAVPVGIMTCWCLHKHILVRTPTLLFTNLKHNAMLLCLNIAIF